MISRLFLVGCLLLACLGVAACDGFSQLPPADSKAELARDNYLANPTRNAYVAFLRANGQAASNHNEPHDGVGIRYQVRALEIEAAEAEATNDARLAKEVVDRVDVMDEDDYLSLYDETVPGSRERLEAARVRAQAVMQ